MWLKSIRKRVKRALLPRKTLQQLYPEFEFGRGTYGVPTVRRWEKNGVLKIGAFCSIGPNVQVFLGGEHRIDWVTTYPFNALDPATAGNAQATKGDVVIGNDVWIGDGVTILSGVQIGDGAVIGARALVTKDIAPYTINGGNPSRCIRKRFEDQIIEQLLSLRWWNFTDKQISDLHPYLASSDIEEFIRQAQQFLPPRPDIAAAA